jgi:ubiquitin conjugation factor E4 A
MWTNEMLHMTGSAQNSSDGFMINLSSVLLQLCKPFCIPPTLKLLKVDARYCRLKKLGNQEYLEAISSEPFLRPCDLNEINADNFELNFMTQCFVATHKSLHLGFRVVHERFLKLVQELNQIQHMYNEASLQSSNQNPDALEMLRKRMDRYMTQFLAMKAMLSENEFLETMLNFHIATAIWLNNLAINENEMEASKAFKPISLPISREFESKCLKSVPEFIVENVSDFVIFLRRFSDKTFGLPNINLEPLMTMIIIFMGSPERMKNPHLRARLAEMLESLMPTLNNETNRYSLRYFLVLFFV